MLFEELKFDAVEFYETFTPIKKEVTVPSNLHDFTEAMSKHHKLDLTIKTTKPILAESKIKTDPNKAIVLYSGGIDSTWSLLHGVEQGLTLYPVYVKGLNPATSSREIKACEKVIQKLGLNLTLYKHTPYLKKLHRSEDNIITTPESLGKLQYALMLCKDLILREKIGKVIVTVDEDNVIYHNPNSMRDENDEQVRWYSDTCISMQTFLPFLEEYVGAEIKGLYPSISKSNKIKKLFEEELFEDTCSCVLNPMFFAGHRKKHYAPKHPNMCGVCWKCKENLKFIAESEKDQSSL